mmetsp:Transcript_4319/g.10970  ORF Transcript_4319/g.10970 Transcript_4319/m.10970 type:complete len:106 (+) Transcript_4319:81-398(+)
MKSLITYTIREKLLSQCRFSCSHSCHKVTISTSLHPHPLLQIFHQLTSELLDECFEIHVWIECHFSLAAITLENVRKIKDATRMAAIHQANHVHTLGQCFDEHLV